MKLKVAPLAAPYIAKRKAGRHVVGKGRSNVNVLFFLLPYLQPLTSPTIPVPDEQSPLDINLKGALEACRPLFKFLFLFFSSRSPTVLRRHL